MRGIPRIELIGLLVSMTLLGCAGRSVPVSISTEQGRAPRAELTLPPEAPTPEELTMPEAVAPEERMKAYPSPGEYVAFSLNVAQTLITRVEGGQKNYRVVHPEVYNLGGITAIHGLVHDRQKRDLILVGKYDPDRQPLTLDDFAVALRARFIYGKWPLLSIDPIEQTEATAMQTVRTEGGIEDTQFGADLFDADYRLKRIGMGLLPAAVPGLNTYWDLGEKRVKQRPEVSYKIGSRFWFYPVLPNVSVREDVVAVQGLKVGVFTEALSAEIDGKKIEDLSTFQNAAGDRFATEVTENFDRLAKVHPSFSRVRGLDELVALAHALEQMEERPDLTFWLKDYPVKSVTTPKMVKVLKRLEQWPVAGGYQGHEVSGGVQLMAIALRLKAGDVTALKEAVLTARPKPDVLSWNFVVGEWLIPTSPGMLRMEDIVPLFAQAFFLQEKKYWDDAITLYGKLIELKPEWDLAYYNRGITYAHKALYDQAIRDFNRALELNSRDADVYADRGIVYKNKGEYDRAIQDHTKALEINPRFARAYNGRGEVYRHKGEYERAILDYTQALEINPRWAEAYSNRGAAYLGERQYHQAIAEFTKALEINPGLAEVYYNRGFTYAENGEDDRAILDYTQALEINARFASAYFNRGIAYGRKGLNDQAISDFNRALEINPRDAEAYFNRGAAYGIKGLYDQAMSDFNQALALNPRYAEAYTNRGAAYRRKGELERAIADYNQAVAINPRLVEAYSNRGSAYGLKGDYERAITDFNQAVAIDPRYAEVYMNRGTAYYRKGDYERAITDFNQALEINPRLLDAYLKKAGACEAAGRLKEAVEAYQRFIQYAPPEDAAYIERARQRLDALRK